MVETTDFTEMSREENEVAQRLDKLNDGVSKLVDSATPPFLLDLFDSTSISQHIRFRATHLVITVSAAATVSITIGSVTRSFEFVGAGTIWLPFPVVIERGTQITLTTSAGTCYGYLVGRSE